MKKVILTVISITAAWACAAGVHVDVLMAFDTTAREWNAQNGFTTESFALSQLEKMNTVLKNSGLNEFDFRLVGTHEGSFSYASSLGIAGTLATATASSDSSWIALRNKREEVGADVVVVLVDTGVTSGNTGLSNGLLPYIGPDAEHLERQWDLEFAGVESYLEYIANLAYAVCDISAANDGYTVPHEVGHIMGAGHSDRLSSSYSTPGPQLFPYSAALMFQGSDGNNYATVMGYNSLDGSSASGHFEVLPYFSSPNLVSPITGDALGDANHDNVNTIRQTYSHIVAFRAEKVPDQPDTPIVIPDTPTDPTPSTPDIPDSPLSQDPARWDAAFVQKQVINGALYDANGNLAGAVQVKTGKVKNHAVKVSATATLLTGKKVSARGISWQIDADSGNLNGTLSFKAPVNEMFFTLGQDHSIVLKNSDYRAESAAVGGPLSTSSLSCTVAFDTLPALDDGWDILYDALPTEVPITVFNGTKWKFEKAPSIKYKKFNEDGYIFYDLIGLDDETKPNVSGMKLSYTAKTGMFKGTFKIYAVNEEGMMPKVKKFNANIIGFMINGEGIGIATCKKPASGPWAVTVR